MEKLQYTTKEINRNMLIKCSGLGVHELRGVTGFIKLVGIHNANQMLRRAFAFRQDKCVCKLRRGLKVTFYYK